VVLGGLLGNHPNQLLPRSRTLLGASPEPSGPRG
jgi:hypothetical protein